MNIKGALDQICDTFGRIEAYAESVERQRNELLDILQESKNATKRLTEERDEALARIDSMRHTAKLALDERDEKITRLEKALDDAARKVAKQATVIENLHLTLSMITVVMASIKDPDTTKLNYAINKLLDSTKSSNGAH